MVPRPISVSPVNPLEMQVARPAADLQGQNLWGRARNLFLFSPADKSSLVVKNLPANAGDIRDVGSIPGSGRSPGGGHGNPLHGVEPGQRSLAGYSPWGRTESDLACKNADKSDVG